jgi:transcriptional regulator with XRE-family HTH domain
MQLSFHTDLYAVLQELLVELRNDRKLTQMQVAERLGVPQSFVSKYETGERRLDAIELFRIAQVLGISLSHLAEHLEQHEAAAATLLNNTIFERWDTTPQELTNIVDANPSLRGMILGYMAERKLRTMWFSGDSITFATKHDDHDRKRKGDLVVEYREHQFVIEAKSLQTNLVQHDGKRWTGKIQCDASDRREITLPDGSSLTTTCLQVGEFDLVAANLFAFENKWQFSFAKNSDLPRSTYKKYTPEQRQYLISSLVPVTFPPEPPFFDSPFVLLDEIIEERKKSKKIIRK